MPAPLHEDALQYLRDHQLDVNSESLNWAMDRLAKTPGLRPSYRMQGASSVDQMAQNGGISTGEIANDGWTILDNPGDTFNPVAAANPNTPMAPRSNKNKGGPQAKIPGSTPPGVPMSKPSAGSDWQGYGGEFAGRDFHAGDGKVPVYTGHGMAGYVPQGETYADPATGETVWKPYYDRMYGARDARIAQGQMTSQEGLTTPAEAAPVSPGASPEQGMFDWLFRGNGQTVNQARPEGPAYDQQAAEALLQAAAGAAMGGGNGGRAVAGLGPRGGGGAAAVRPSVDPGPPMGGNPPPAVRGGPSVGPTAPKSPPTAPKPSAPNGSSEKIYSMDEAAAKAREYGVPSTPTAAKSTTSQMADTALGAKSKPAAKPKANTKSPQTKQPSTAKDPRAAPKRNTKSPQTAKKRKVGVRN